MVPEFAVVGHPNEGKSSVLSTLAEDDSVRVSPLPGETVECRPFPVVIDGREVIRFTDTPGFQNPRKVLQILEGYGGGQPFGRLLAEHGHDPALQDDCELLAPLVAGAGIIYVVDGSRPIRNVDRAEMEILRLTGRPRLAIINAKDDRHDFSHQWRDEFRRSFNSVRIFNAHRATYRERIELLQALKHIEQDWLVPLESVIAAFEEEWHYRSEQVVEIISSLLRHCLAYRLGATPEPGSDEQALRKKLAARYNRHISQKEKEAHSQIRRLHKHNIFQLSLPPASILEHDLFNERTWQFLGLDKGQLVVAGGLSGAAIGAGLDLAAGGVSFGLFSALGGLAGMAATGLGGRELLRGRRVLGMRLDGEEIRVGPHANPQFLFILLDRALLYYEHVVNWAHGRREQAPSPDESGLADGYTRHWPAGRRELCARYFREVTKGGAAELKTDQQMRDLLRQELAAISNQEYRGIR
ncbi:MAG: GTPase/DUF3482 domain-containing protein [Thermodesulfobacteriota bacterium]